MDDVYHFLTQHNISASHQTVQYPPSTGQFQSMVEANLVSIPTISIHPQPSSNNKTISTPRLLVLSAADKDSLKRMTELHKQHIAGITSLEYLDSLLYTLDSRRSLLPWRSYATIENSQSITDSLTNFSEPSRAISKPKTAFVFTGQGAQWARMGHELLANPVFRKSLQEADVYLQGLGCKWSLMGA